MTDDNDDKTKHARALYLDGQPLEQIAATLEASIDWLRGVLGLESVAGVKPERPVPVAKPTPSDAEGLRKMNEALTRTRPAERDIGGFCDPRPLVGGGAKDRYGNPARYPLPARSGVAWVPARRRGI
jgi:hypothetical protein